MTLTPGQLANRRQQLEAAIAEKGLDVEDFELQALAENGWHTAQRLSLASKEELEACVCKGTAAALKAAFGSGRSAHEVPPGGGVFSLDGWYEQLQVIAPAKLSPAAGPSRQEAPTGVAGGQQQPRREVSVASFTIIEGLYHAQLMFDSALVSGLGGRFHVHSASCIQVRLVSTQADHLQDFLDTEVMRAPSGAELKKAITEPDLITTYSSSASDDRLASYQAISMSWRSLNVKAQYEKALKQDRPSGLGRSSDREVSRASSRSWEEEEEE